ncbi:unnamed protein product [Ceratitis capitata]|uniref:(Mediterranean fruit fly) hypothetical protein n=1 Tax=Ceratitis capitata TaxID=7213 RepID=A0A811U4N4_CERCA|nr:unnamed protein product [Ceratitis capitata]
MYDASDAGVDGETLKYYHECPFDAANSRAFTRSALCGGSIQQGRFARYSRIKGQQRLECSNGSSDIATFGLATDEAEANGPITRGNVANKMKRSLRACGWRGVGRFAFDLMRLVAPSSTTTTTTTTTVATSRFSHQTLAATVEYHCQRDIDSNNNEISNSDAHVNAK